MHNFVHIEIKVTDLGIAKSFYESVFQWKVQLSPDMSNVAFYQIDEEGELVSGAFLLTEKIPEECSIMLYINSRDITKKLDEIKSHDGQIIFSKTELPGGHGFIGRFRDPFGNLLGLWSEE